MRESRRSIFACLADHSRLWQKPENRYRFNSSDVIYQGHLLKYSKSKQKYFSRYFILINNSLLYTKEKGSAKVYRSLDLTWVQIYYETTIYEGKKTELLRFVQNLKYCNLIVTDANEALFWKKYLSKICIQTNFDDKFSLLHMIGKGTFATVYQTRNRWNNKEYAVKVYSKDFLNSDPAIKNLFFNEIRVMRSLNHANLVKLKEVHETCSSLYLIMECIQGSNLASFLEPKSIFTYEELTDLLKILLTCIEYLDSKKIVHRDIKPENIMLLDKGNSMAERVKLIDFGLSTYFNSDNIRDICGTPGFVAPEILRQKNESIKNIDTKVDVFSLGIVFYELIHGKIPFEDKFNTDILELNKQCDIDYDMSRFIKLPFVHSLLSTMLNPTPFDRISVKKALLHELFNCKDINHNNQTTKITRVIPKYNYESSSNVLAKNSLNKKKSTVEDKKIFRKNDPKLVFKYSSKDTADTLENIPTISTIALNSSLNQSDISFSMSQIHTVQRNGLCKNLSKE